MNLVIGVIVSALAFLALCIMLGKYLKWHRETHYPEPPTCFGDGLSLRFPHMFAERCCDDCPFSYSCLGRRDEP